MKKINKKVLMVVEHVTRREVVKNENKWPPFCLGIFHQPKRPISQVKYNVSAKNSK